MRLSSVTLRLPSVGRARPEANCQTGNIASISLFANAALRRSIAEDSIPYTIAARLWKYTLEQGKPNPPTAAFASLTLAFCACRVGMLEGTSGRFWLNAAAAALTLGMIPYTVVWILPINGRLIDIANSRDEAVSDIVEVKELLSRWSKLNWIRSAIPLTASCLAFAAAVY
ncbi:hypothetical protein JDV02_009139 [Purpureocillium takamizusanense]|uniref:DUF1772-domain-containing protein n=1 Tax=Purpureocillium takamizusanense TaxID=2060973 RepID=A0A9Q8QR88_9HYPO|nr:uncharacterized protein JDV02_009139 [Purpureocillium takamizusanense]UNI23309.1 hypothetical protein JDV02_009139 [Purpureocillium takamizusanense]